MNRATWQRVESVFNGAVERTGAAREAYLAESCAGDAKLRAEVEALLREHDSDPHFLEQPLFDLQRTPTPTPTSRPGPHGPLTPDSQASPAGERIGAYRIVREVGAGGMGIVYLAMHEGPGFERPVALKVIRHGMDTEQMLRRFQTERRILAALSHPNAARLLDAGATPDGRPYFVMDFVEGVAIDVHCDRHGFGVAGRLRLFQAVCGAVDHAHSNLVVHRDIKPGNILVTESGAPVLLDFGIGKLLDPLDSRGTASTLTDARAFTPAYASPEQIRGEPVSTATDVYGLGVLLFQLLTGRRPFDDAPSGGFERAVLDTEPPRPSAVASRHLERDLDAIVLKSLRKEPERRYTSVAALSDDIQRYLDGQPVRAHAGNVSYRAGKFLRRHRIALAAATIVFVSLVGTTVYSRAQTRAVARERDKALEVQSFLLEMFGAAGRDRGDTVSIRQLLDGQAAIVPIAYADRPELRAQMLTVIAEGYDRLGLFAQAEPLAREALEIRKSTLRPNHPDVAFSTSLLGWIKHERGASKEAEALLREAMSLWPNTRPANPGFQARTLNDLGIVREAAQALDEAAELYRQALDIRRRELGGSNRAVAITASNLGGILYKKGDLKGAIQVAESALVVMRRASGPDHQRSTIIQGNLAAMRAATGDWAGSEAEYRDVLARQTRVLGRQHPVTSGTIYALGSVLRSQKKYAEAETYLIEALGNFEKTFGQEHLRTSQAMVLLGGVRVSQGRAREGIPLLERALAVQRKLRGETHKDVVALRARVDSLKKL